MKKIRWEGKVHELWALQYHKKIERQEKYNNYYETL